jgi:predicted outer membrane lipoprotein
VRVVWRLGGTLRFLTEKKIEAAVRKHGKHGDLLAVAVATGTRFGVITALWVEDVAVGPPPTSAAKW